VGSHQTKDVPVSRHPPPGRTVLVTELGADLLSEMGGTQTREAVVRCVAGIAEAARPVGTVVGLEIWLGDVDDPDVWDAQVWLDGAGVFIDQRVDRRVPIQRELTPGFTGDEAQREEQSERDANQHGAPPEEI
jgi:hypothetical protein